MEIEPHVASHSRGELRVIVRGQDLGWRGISAKCSVAVFVALFARHYRHAALSENRRGDGKKDETVKGRNPRLSCASLARSSIVAWQRDAMEWKRELFTISISSCTTLRVVVCFV